jgi:nucleotide-binding universal stress UspA family protein
MKRIIIPTDFSPESMNTIYYGVQMAKILGYELELLHIIQPNYPGFVSMYSTALDYKDMDVRPRIEEAEKRFVSVIDDLKVNFPECPAIGFSVKSGFYEEEIIASCAENEQGILMLTGEEQHAKMNWLVADSNIPIVNRISNPTVIVPRESSFEAVDRIIYATDFLRQDIDSLKVLSGWAKSFEARIIVVHVTDNQDFKEEIEKEGFQKMLVDEVDYPHINLLTISSSDMASGLNKFMADMNGKMMALLKENEGFWKSLMHGNDTRDLIFKAHKPVIIFHLK